MAELAGGAGPEGRAESAGAGPEGRADVVVVGSGGAGLTAALAAARAGASVTVLEAHSRWGGTTGLSAGAVWVPANHRMADHGIADSFADAWTYCGHHAPGRDAGLVESYLRAGPAMARFVEKHTPIEFAVMDYPDTFAEKAGGRTRGRHLEVAPMDIGDIGPTDETVWPAPFPMVLTNDELFGGCVHGGTSVPVTLIGRRIAADEVTLGLALVLGLLTGCEEAGVTMVSGTRVVSLVQDVDGRVTGVVADRDGERVTYQADRGVILAAGGFEHDRALTTRQVAGPLDYPLSTPVGRGDGLRLAASAGAELAYLGECWCTSVTPVEGRIWDDPERTPRPFMLLAERAMPHCLWVNRDGRRFVNEASHNCALTLSEVDPATHQPRHLPAWSICDAQYREAYAFAGVTPGAKIPSHVVVADTLPELAALIGVDADALVESVDRFNGFVHSGHDDDFGRGDAAYDRYNGDVRATNPTLGTVEAPPFFAVRVHRGALGTKGGPRIDGRARVLRWDGTPVPGLYAAGNNAASIFGPGAVAHGMHLGVALTMGWLAGTTAGGEDPERASGWLTS